MIAIIFLVFNFVLWFTIKFKYYKYVVQTHCWTVHLHGMDIPDVVFILWYRWLITANFQFCSTVKLLHIQFLAFHFHLVTRYKSFAACDCLMTCASVQMCLFSTVTCQRRSSLGASVRCSAAAASTSCGLCCCVLIYGHRSITCIQACSVSDACSWRMFLYAGCALLCQLLESKHWSDVWIIVMSLIDTEDCHWLAFCCPCELHVWCL